MKMPPKQFQAIRAAIKGKFTTEAVSGYRESYRKRSLSDVRLAWDLFWASGYSTRNGYPLGLNDSHITTALLRILAEFDKAMPQSK